MSQIFDSLGNKPQQNNPAQMLQQLKNDPAQFLQSMGYNIPSGVDFHNPQSIVNGLMQSGQVNNARYNMAMQAMQRMGRK